MRIYIKFLIKNVYAADPYIVLYLLAVAVVIISFGMYFYFRVSNNFSSPAAVACAVIFPSIKELFAHQNFYL